MFNDHPEREYTQASGNGDLLTEKKIWSNLYSNIKQLITGIAQRTILNTMVGLLDFMARPQVDPQTGEIYPIYGSFNDPDMLKTQPKDAIPIIYVIKASAKQNSEMHSNCYSRIYSGHVYFLIKEQEAKNRLLSTKVGQKMNTEQKARRLLPHELTTILFDEIGNLRLKQTGSGSDVVLEQINSRFGKDKFSSLEYGLWRVKELEDAYLKTKGKRTKKRDLIFFTPGG